ncbi:MAG: excinuclease ABC subunit UvrB [Acidobacteriota bacterium]
MSRFTVSSDFQPCGDQPAAIESLLTGLKAGDDHQVLLGVTGSGKTFSIAKVVESHGRPTLVLVHNKTLAGQLYLAFKKFFPENAVEYFVSYYDYYQPEAYVPQSDTYIEKETSINDEIDKLRHSATRSLFERRDVVIVASVSCIYGLGSPENYKDLCVDVDVSDSFDRQDLLRGLVDIQYERSPYELRRGSFRVRGDVVEVQPASEDRAIRIELWGDEVEGIQIIDPLRGEVLEKLDHISIYPNSHHVTPRQEMKRAIADIRAELDERLAELEKKGRLLEAQRLHQRTTYDLEMMAELGSCPGIENYSRHLTGRSPGEPPPTLLDYLGDDALVVVDESHVTLPQVRGMYEGDRSRKQNLVDHGFRLPSALDNRPLRFEEFEERLSQRIHVSATPGSYELEATGGAVVEQIVRPTGLLDPPIVIRPVDGQVDDLLGEVRARTAAGERVLVTTLTKRMTEELTDYYRDLGVKVEYLHSDIDALERSKIIRALRAGEHDVLVGVNLLREGLDLPEVSLVAILDADKEGFLRSSGSLIQTAGRAARNVNGLVIMYADKITGSMEEAIDEGKRRRAVQEAYNQEHGITPRSVERELDEPMGLAAEADYLEVRAPGDRRKKKDAPEELFDSPDEIRETVAKLEKEMRKAAESLEFEKAAELRDRVKYLKETELFSA